VSVSQGIFDGALALVSHASDELVMLDAPKRRRLMAPPRGRRRTGHFERPSLRFVRATQQKAEESHR